jgi:hypothetical protein
MAKEPSHRSRNNERKVRCPGHILGCERESWYRSGKCEKNILVCRSRIGEPASCLPKGRALLRPLPRGVLRLYPRYVGVLTFTIVSTTTAAQCRRVSSLPLAESLFVLLFRYIKLFFLENPGVSGWSVVKLVVTNKMGTHESHGMPVFIGGGGGGRIELPTLGL